MQVGPLNFGGNYVLLRIIIILLSQSETQKYFELLSRRKSLLFHQIISLSSLWRLLKYFIQCELLIARWTLLELFKNQEPAYPKLILNVQTNCGYVVYFHCRSWKSLLEGGQVFKRVRPVNGLIPGGWLDNFVQSLTLGKNTFVLSKTLV